MGGKTTIATTLVKLELKHLDQWSASLIRLFPIMARMGFFKPAPC